ncbi:YqhG family protein [Aneurinibacillus terranovensis]|uniref:YqhG family protein n=1 Tax=Aneurinibacillus terranovensis TaxID=278991 RepID=UPI0003FF6E41|nr:YqhG family protein [Aneurinibacillus terranovensis]
MNKMEIRRYLERYFDAHQSHYTQVHPSYFQVRLPVEVDKDLGNRPFYWTYVERLNIEPQPMHMTFIFDKENAPDDVRGEEMTFGSPRLHQFFASTRRRGRYIRLFECPGKDIKRAALIPWLGVNYKISYICDRKKDVLLSLGINLLHGTIQEDFFSRMQERPLDPVLPNYTYTVQSIFTIDSAIKKLEDYVQNEIAKENPVWAVEAERRLNEELAIVENFYAHKKSETDANESEKEEKKANSLDYKTKRIQELRWQYEPRIEVDIINGGLFYLL